MKNEYDYLNDVKMDFDVYNEESITEEEIRKMSKINNRDKKISKGKIAVIACAAVLSVSTCVAAANGQLEKIIKTVTTGHNYFVQIDPASLHELPVSLQGKLYNADGEPLTAITNDEVGSLYDENGTHLDTKELEEMFNKAFDEQGVELGICDETNFEDSKIHYATLDEAQASADFEIKVPEYIPEGFEFADAYAFKDNDGSASGLYRNFEYIGEDGKKLFFSERLINEETAFVSSTDGVMEETEINGRAAVIMDNTSLSFETEDSVSVSISTKGSITKDELIKIAESIS